MDISTHCKREGQKESAGEWLTAPESKTKPVWGVRKCTVGMNGRLMRYDRRKLDNHSTVSVCDCLKLCALRTHLFLLSPWSPKSVMKHLDCGHSSFSASWYFEVSVCVSAHCGGLLTPQKGDIMHTMTERKEIWVNWIYLFFVFLSNDVTCWFARVNIPFLNIELAI